jgi:hypothetical protein
MLTEFFYDMLQSLRFLFLSTQNALYLKLLHFWAHKILRIYIKKCAKILVPSSRARWLIVIMS